MTETRIQTEKTPAGATNGATSLDRFREWLYPHRPVLVGSAALFAALEETVKTTDRRRLIRLPHAINDPEFAEAAVAHFLEIAT